MKNNLPDFDEAKLTAYALNELDAAERGAVEKILAENADARRWMAEVQQTATLLEGELKAEECPALTSAQARELQQKIRAADAPGFVQEWAANHAMFPRGVDLILCAGNRLAALPRSVRIEEG